MGFPEPSDYCKCGTLINGHKYKSCRGCPNPDMGYSNKECPNPIEEITEFSSKECPKCHNEGDWVSNAGTRLKCEKCGHLYNLKTFY